MVVDILDQNQKIQLILLLLHQQEMQSDFGDLQNMDKKEIIWFMLIITNKWNIWWW